MVEEEIDGKICIKEDFEFHCEFLQSLPTPIKNVIGWKCPILTGSIISIWLILIVLIKTVSFISVIAYVGLFFIFSSMVLRFYSNFVNNDTINPFQEILDKDIKIYLNKISNIVLDQIDNDNSYLNNAIKYLRDIFLLNDYSKAIKFFFLNLTMVYVGMFFNLIDLLMLLVLATLTGPKIYSMYKLQIDNAGEKIINQLQGVINIIKSKISTLPMIGGNSKKLR